VSRAKPRKKPEPDHVILPPAGRYVRKNFGYRFSGKFGPASKCRQLTAADRRAVEDDLRRQGMLS
jgi:hypothetical protein